MASENKEGKTDLNEISKDNSESVVVETSFLKRMNIFVITGIIFGLTVIILIFFILLEEEQNFFRLSEDALAEGISADVMKNSVIQFGLSSGSYEFSVDSLEANLVVLSIGDKKINLVKDENIELDLDDDGTADYSIDFTDFFGNSARLFFIEIPEEVFTNSSEDCVPSWSCSVWGDCIDGIRRRECSDSNNCGNEKNKPILTKGCNDKIEN